MRWKPKIQRLQNLLMYLHGHSLWWFRKWSFNTFYTHLNIIQKLNLFSFICFCILLGVFVDFLLSIVLSAYWSNLNNLSIPESWYKDLYKSNTKTWSASMYWSIMERYVGSWDTYRSNEKKYPLRCKTREQMDSWKVNILEPGHRYSDRSGAIEQRQRPPIQVKERSNRKTYEKRQISIQENLSLIRL